jgi:1-phosphatidylinositol phosphodiesterase
VNFGSGARVFCQPQWTAGGALGVRGVDPFLLVYQNQGADVHTPVIRTGVLMLDFPGGALINKIISYD